MDLTRPWRSPHAFARALSMLVVPVLLAATACTAGSGDDAAPPKSPAPSPAPSPTPSPSAVERTLGQPATVELPADKGGTTQVRIAVTEVTQGRIGHLSEFRLDEQTRQSTPYYAEVRVTNTGPDLAQRTVALWALDSTGTVRPPAELLGAFPRCQNDPLPRRFARGDTARTCLLYLVPQDATMEAVQYRFDDRPPFSWPVG